MDKTKRAWTLAFALMTLCGLLVSWPGSPMVPCGIAAYLLPSKSISVFQLKRDATRFMAGGFARGESTGLG